MPTFSWIKLYSHILSSRRQATSNYSLIAEVFELRYILISVNLTIFKPCIIIFPNLPMPGRQRWQNLIQEQISLSQLSAQRKPLHLLYRSLSNYHMSEYFQPLDNKVGAKTADCYAARAEWNIGQTFSICKRAGTNQASSQKDLSDCRMTSMNNLRSDAREHHWSLYSVLTCSLWKTLSYRNNMSRNIQTDQACASRKPRLGNSRQTFQ